MNYKFSTPVNKLNVDRRRSLENGVKKLASYVDKVSLTNQQNNPIIHDTYGNNFYAYKYVAPNVSIRILYRITENELEIHMWHFKCGRKDGSSYIEEFENYVEEYNSKKN